MADQVFIRQLKVSANIGVYPWERVSSQDILFDIDIEVDATKIAESDDINHAVDYAKVCEYITKFAGENRFNLIETLAHKVAELLIDNFDITWLRLTLIKPEALNDGTSPGIVIEREPSLF